MGEDWKVAPARVTLHARISGPAAFIKVDYDFINTSSIQDGFFSLPVPCGAAIHACVLEVAGARPRIGKVEALPSGKATGPPALKVPVGRLRPGHTARISLEYAQELSWLDERRLELRFPLDGSDLDTGDFRAHVELDPCWSYAGVSSTHDIELPGHRVQIDGINAHGEFGLRFLLEESSSQPLLLTHKGHFLLSFRVPGRMHGFRWTDGGLGLAPESQEPPRIHAQPQQPMTLYGRHMGSGELAIEGATRYAQWRARLRPLACDNPAILLLWAERAVLDLGQPFSPRFRERKIRELGLEYSICTPFTGFSWAAEPERLPEPTEPVDTLAIAWRPGGAGCRERRARPLPRAVGNWLEPKSSPGLVEEDQQLRTDLLTNAPVQTRLEWYLGALREWRNGASC